MTAKTYSTKSNARSAAKREGLDLDTLVFVSGGDDRWSWRSKPGAKAEAAAADKPKGEPRAPKAGEDDAFKGVEFLDRREGGTADELAERARENVRNSRGGVKKAPGLKSPKGGAKPADDAATLAEYAKRAREKQERSGRAGGRVLPTKGASKRAAAKPAAFKGTRPGSKAAMIAELLTRKEGCTTADVLAATGWPAVSMPQQARIVGLELTKVKDGKVTRYHGAPAKGAAKSATKGAEAHASA